MWWTFIASTRKGSASWEFPPLTPPPSLDLPNPPLPIDDADGGCDTGDKFYKAWSRENPAISIIGDDVISADGKEIYSFLVQRGIKNLLIMGVHANMCILNRSFAIKQMTQWGIRCVLVRDLTDSMYNPQDRPYVSHDQGTELVIEYIEKYWCPSMLSTDLAQALPQPPKSVPTWWVMWANNLATPLNNAPPPPGFVAWHPNCCSDGLL